MALYKYAYYYYYYYYYNILKFKCNIVTCPTYPDEFILNVVVAPFSQLSVVIVIHSVSCRVW